MMQVKKSGRKVVVSLGSSSEDSDESSTSSSSSEEESQDWSNEKPQRGLPNRRRSGILSKHNSSYLVSQHAPSENRISKNKCWHHHVQDAGVRPTKRASRQTQTEQKGVICQNVEIKPKLKEKLKPHSAVIPTLYTADTNLNHATLRVRKDEGSKTIEDYSSQILREVGPRHWLQHLMKELDSAGPLSRHTNVAIEIIRNFAIVIFTSRGNKNGKKARNLINKIRKKIHVHEKNVLEIVLDDTAAGGKTYNDLVAITKHVGLPQIFIDEVFYSSYEDIKSLHKQNRLTRAILSSVGFENQPCKICKKSGMNYHEHKADYKKL